jgi:hypothetical protein
MKTWCTIAAVLGALVLTDCRGRTAETTARPDKAVASAPAASAPTIGAAPDAKESSTSVQEPAAPEGPALAAPPVRRAARPTPRATTATPAPADRTATQTTEQPGLTVTETPTTPPSPPVQPPVSQELTLTAGTVLPLILTTELSSASAQMETPVRARLQRNVVVNGHVALPEGALLTGVVTDVEPSGRVEGRAHLAFTFDRVQVRDARVMLRTHPIRYEAEPTKSDDAAKIGGGAIGGAIIGGILGGAKGAAKGAAIGGAAGAGAVVMTRGEEVSLARGTTVAAILALPLTVTVSDP